MQVVASWLGRNISGLGLTSDASNDNPNLNATSIPQSLATAHHDHLLAVQMVLSFILIQNRQSVSALPPILRPALF